VASELSGLICLLVRCFLSLSILSKKILQRHVPVAADASLFAAIILITVPCLQNYPSYKEKHFCTTAPPGTVKAKAVMALWNEVHPLYRTDNVEQPPAMLSTT
jgi:hypothetical protein